ncbi:tRNA 2'-phosphotransferase [Batrachochytrium dendrobatidis]|nr:tRNA 2'-phosphotransferase [Batrachochytrium dendrobatidis]
MPNHNPADGNTKKSHSRTSKNDSEEVRISKALSYLLRHGAEKERLVIESDGFVKLKDILSRKQFSGQTLESIQHLVESNAKQRFALRQDPTTLQWSIRANQGHSINVNVEMRTVRDSSEIPLVVHGTYQQHLALILKQGLRSMSRKHIHFAAGLPEHQDITSGMRNNCNILIYVNTEKAMKDGIVFVQSANNVILTEGVDGVLHPRYFSKITDRSGKAIVAPKEGFEESA